MSLYGNIEKGGDLWLRLLNTDKKILIWGMGNGSEKLLEICEKRGIRISGIFCSDGFERNKIFHGYKVDGMSRTLGEYPNPVILTAFGTPDKNLLDKIYSLSEKYEIYAPDLPVYHNSDTDLNSEIFDTGYLVAHSDIIGKARSLFKDETSLEIFDNLIAYRLSGRLDYLKNASCDMSPFDAEKYFKICVDAGAYRGDTIEERFAVSPEIEKIYAIEPDEKCFAKLTSLYGDNNKIVLVNSAVGDRNGTDIFLSGNGRGGTLGRYDGRAKKRIVEIKKIDTVLNGKPVDFIKYDVEGAEKQALEGSRATIENHLPRLRVSVYHRADDLFTLPIFLDEIAKGRYRFALRRKFCIPAWETEVEAIPNM